MSVITLRDEQLLLDPDHALVWPAHATVMVADTHFGKSAVFRRDGLALPEGNDDDDLVRLQALIERHAARKLYILGDFVHGVLPRRTHFYGRFNQWRSALDVELHIVLGNHDRYLDTSALDAVHWHEHTSLGPFELVHEPQPASDGFYLCGHIHPIARLSTRTDALRMPIFWQRANGLVLPSFGSLTGGYLIEKTIGEKRYGVGPESVVLLP